MNPIPRSSMRSTETMSDGFSLSSMESKKDNTTSDANSMESGVNVERDKMKSTNGKTGLLPTSDAKTKTSTGDSLSQPLSRWASNLQKSNGIVLHRILKRLAPENNRWLTCPKCGHDWNKLTPNGMCYECDPKEQEDRNKFYGPSPRR